MTAFLSALGSGISAKKILEYIMRQSPELAPKITKSLGAGISADKVLSFFSKDKNFEKLKSSFGKEYSTENNANPIVQGQNIRGQNLGQDPASALQRNLPGIVGGTAIAAAAPFASRAAQSALSRALPSSLQKFGVQPLQTNNQTLSSESNPLNTASAPTSQLPLGQTTSSVSQQPPSNQVAASIPEPANIQQPEEKTNIVDKLWNNFEKGRDKGFDFESDAFLKIAKRMKSTGEIRNKEDFEKFFNLFDQKKNEGKDLPAALRESSAEYDNQKLSPIDLKPKPTELGESPKIEKNSIVSSPNGVGEVKEVRNGQAIIDVDGKLHKVKEEDLETSPLPEKDLADLHEDLIKGIEFEIGEDVSRMVQWAGYNPDTNTLTFLPHSGSLYTYDDISQEDAALLTDILSTRKTTGSNFFGAWKKDSKSPIGAALSKLIRKLQSERGGKGNEYSGKHDTIYSAYEPAIEAKKRKKKKK